MESVVSIAEAVNSGTTSARAVLAEHIARHHSIHPALNALVQTRHGDADREAAALDRHPAGLLAGVPVSVKECFSIEGLVTTLGIPARRGCVDRTDAPIVSRLRRAGASRGPPRRARSVRSHGASAARVRRLADLDVVFREDARLATQAALPPAVAALLRPTAPRARMPPWPSVVVRGAVARPAPRRDATTHAPCW